jgi:hypothetical protein
VPKEARTGGAKSNQDHGSGSVSWCFDRYGGGMAGGKSEVDVVIIDCRDDYMCGQIELLP